MPKTVHIGFDNVVNADKIVAILTPNGSQTKRSISSAKEDNKFLDTTCGRRSRSVIVMDSGHVILSAIMPLTISERMTKNAVNEVIVDD